MPRKKTDTTAVTLRIPNPLVELIDEIVADTYTTRTMVINFALAAGLGVAKQMLQPAGWLHDPTVLQSFEEGIRKLVDEEKSQ